MTGAAPPVSVAAAVAGAFGFVVFLAAKAPEVETARIARPTRIVFFFMLSSPLTWKKDAAPAVEHKAHISASWSARFELTRSHCERPTTGQHEKSRRWVESATALTHYSRGGLGGDPQLTAILC